MRWIGIVSFGIAALLAGPALADSEIHYGPAPAWVQRQPIPVASPSSGGSVQTLLMDREVNYHLDGEDYYQEVAYKVLNTQGLQQLGTITVPWDPVLADVTIHTAQIIRDGKVIDLLADGSGFKILQRETGLANSTLNGALTAMKEITDFRVGDTILFASSIHMRAPLTGSRIEDKIAMGHAGVAEHIHFRDIFPKSVAIHWKAYKGMDGAKLEDHGDTQELIWDATQVTKPRPPTGAPARFTLLGQIDVSAFDSWSDISRLFAPLYASASTLAADSPLKAEAAKIKAANQTPEARAAAALQLVETQVRYLATELGQGGLTPTPADVTWAQRYGDCKAKTALLMALLKELDIDAEPFVVSSTGGDALPDRLPMIHLFDHIMVRSQIGGKTYWLDGTRTGDRGLANLTAPPFGYGLPIKASGSALEKIVRQPALLPTTELTTTVDMTKGLDQDGPIEITEILRGDSAVSFEQRANATPRADLEQALIQTFNRASPWANIKSATFNYDEANQDYRVVAQGRGRFQWISNAGRQQVVLGAAYAYQLPDRAPLEDQDAPYTLSYPFSSLSIMRIKLPAAGAGFTLVGPDANLIEGGEHVQRTAAIKDGVVEVRLVVEHQTDEVPAALALTAKTRYSTAASSRNVVLTSLPTGVGVQPRPAIQTTGATPAPAAGGPSGPAMTAVLAALQKGLGGDREGARRDLDELVRQNPRLAAAYGARGALLMDMKAYEPALSDARQAIMLDPTVAQNFVVETRALIKLKRYDEALAAAGALPKTAAQSVQTGMEYARACALIGLGRSGDALSAFDGAYGRHDEASAWDCSLDEIAEVVRALDEPGRTAFENALSAHPGSAMARLIKGHLLESQDYRLAVVQYDEAVRQNPDWLIARRERANANFHARDYAAALTDLDWLATKTPNDSNVYRLRASVYSAQKDPAKAIEALGKAIQLSPQSSALFADRCETRAAANIDLDNALSDCDEAIRLSPSGQDAYDSRGLVYLRLGKPANAVADYDTVLATRDNPDSHYGRGLARHALGDETGASADFDAAVKLKPDVAATFAAYGLTR